MKRFQAEYSENSITYWPAYEAGKIGIIFFVVIGTLFIATSIWTLLDNPSRKTYLGILVAFPLVVVALCSVFSLILRTMHTKIVVSKEGIGYFKSNVAIEKQISWKEVSAIYFSQDLWYGNKSCRIVFNKSLSPKLHEKDICDFVLPVSSVDEQKLLQLIPNHLWKNNPLYAWYN